jgi:hypothetical protein
LPTALQSYIGSFGALKDYTCLARCSRVLRDASLTPLASPHAIVLPDSLTFDAKQAFPLSLLRLRPHTLDAGACITSNACIEAISHLTSITKLSVNFEASTTSKLFVNFEAPATIHSNLNERVDTLDYAPWSTRLRSLVHLRVQLSSKMKDTSSLLVACGPTLTTLWLRQDCSAAAFDYSVLFCCTALQNLTLNDMYWQSIKQRDDLTQLTCHARKLCEMKLLWQGGRRSILVSIDLTFLTAFTTLTHLTVSGPNVITIPTLPFVKHANIVDSRIPLTTLRNWTSLASLAPSDFVTQDIRHIPPSLVELDLTHAHVIDEEFILALTTRVSTPPSLPTIVLPTIVLPTVVLPTIVLPTIVLPSPVPSPQDPSSFASLQYPPRCRMPTSFRRLLLPRNCTISSQPHLLAGQEPRTPHWMREQFSLAIAQTIVSYDVISF